MKNVTTLAALSSLSIGAVAMADMGDLVGQNTLRYYGADGTTQTSFADAAYAVMDLYVQFNATNTHGYDNADSHMLNVLDTNITANNFTLFHHSDLTNATGGSWKPSFSFDIPGQSNSSIDSFVTIGGGVGAQAAVNVTTPDPNLGDATSDAIFNPNVGWFINPPTSDQGDVLGADYEVWIGRFVVTGDEARAGANFDIAGSVGYNYGDATGAYFGDMGGNFTFTPAPGALALMGLAGLGVRRRRA